MAVETQHPASVAPDRAGEALAYLHALLQHPGAGGASLDEVLRKVADAFAATGAGLVRSSDGAVLGLYWSPSIPQTPLPWSAQPDLLARIRQAPAGLVVTDSRGPWLCASVFTREAEELILWLQGSRDRTWTTAESAALVLNGQTLARLSQAEGNEATWVRQLERSAHQRR